MSMDAPAIDDRSFDDIVGQVLDLTRYYCPEWQPGQVEETLESDDPAKALVYLFARLMEILIHRLNRVPEKYFLAFLNCIGARPRPPCPARTLLQFSLAQGAKTVAWVPAGSPVSTEETRYRQEQNFETLDHLVVTPVRLMSAFTLDPGTDTYHDASAIVSGVEKAAFEVFKGKERIEHCLYLGDDRLFGLNETSTKGDVTLRFAFSEGNAGFRDIALKWAYAPDQGAWQPLTVEPANLDGNPLYVTFSIPADMGKVNVSGHYCPWIKLQLAEAVSTIGGRLPEIESISGSIDCSAHGLLPDACFTNQLPIDPPRHFYPFGPAPTGQHIFYLASDEVFSKAGADISISLTLDEPGVQGSGEKLELTWEYWDGKGWQSIVDLHDYTHHFSEEPLLRESGTEIEIPVIALRGVGKAYEIRLRQRGIDTVKKLLSLSESELVDIIREGGTQPLNYYVSQAANILEAARLGLYDREWPDSMPEVRRGGIEFHCPKIEPKEVNLQTHYWIRLRISAGHYGVPAYYDDQAQAWQPGNLKPPKIGEIKLSCRYRSPLIPVDKIILKNNFEYALKEQGAGPFLPFVPPVGPEPAFYAGFDAPFSPDTVSLFFQVARQVESSRQLQWEYSSPGGWKRLAVKNETLNLSRQGHVRFIGPKDFIRTENFALRQYWLRVRLVSPAGSFSPELLRVYLNTVWAENVETIRDELLGSSDGRAGQTFQFKHSPVLPGQQVRVGEYEATESRVPWQPKENFYASGPRDRHYLIEPASGEIRFGDGIRGMIPPPGTDNIRCSVYRTGGGIQGNVAAHTVSQLKTSIANIDRVKNVLPATGGMDAETLDEIKVRGPLLLKHRDRAVTVEDFEWLMKEAPGDIAVSKCIPVSHYSDKTIVIVIVPDLDEPRPYPDEGLIQQVAHYIHERCLGSLSAAGIPRVQVTGPGYIEVSVNADIVPENIEQSGIVQEQVIASLQNFFHPLKGGPDHRGWPFGRAVHLSEVMTVIQNTEGVNYVKSLRLCSPDLEPGAGGPIVLAPHYLACSGSHSINIVIDS